MDDGKRQTACGFHFARGGDAAVFGLRSAGGRQPGIAADTAAVETAALLSETGAYTTQEDVALYLHLYGELPGNFITKAEARELGWDGGGLEDVAPDKCIGGDFFGNYEGLLPEADGRTYFECDINTLGASSRGPERIVYSSDG